MADDNSKLPIDPWSDGTITPKYGWVYGSADALGGHKFTYRNINEPDKNSSQELTPSGSYKTIHQDADKKRLLQNYILAKLEIMFLVADLNILMVTKT